MGVVSVRVQAVRLPCLGVGIDVQPDGFIICLGTDDVVMEGFSPDGVMEVFGYAALSLLDDVGNRRGAQCAPLRPGNSAAIGWVPSKINALCPAYRRL